MNEIKNIMLNTFGNWIGSMFGRRGGFGFGYQNYIVGQRGPVWIDVNKPQAIFDSIPQLNTILDKRGSMLSNMSIVQNDFKTGEKLDKDNEDKELRDKLEQPNALQSMNEWIKEQNLHVDLYGNAFQYHNKPSKISFVPVSMMNISPRYIAPILSGKLFDQVKLEDIITGYELQGYGFSANRKFKTDEILYIKTCGPDNAIIGVSHLPSQKYPLSNTEASYVGLNTLSINKGPSHIISSSDNKDAVGPVKMTTDAKKQLEDDFTKDYGLDATRQRQFMITRAMVNVHQIGSPVKELLFLEQIDANFLTLCDGWGLNANLFSNKNATFENIKQGLLQTYQDTIFPIADSRMQALTKKLNAGLKEPKIFLTADYSHLEIIKSNRLQGLQAIESLTRSILQLVAQQIISPALATQIFQNELSSQVVL